MILFNIIPMKVMLTGYTSSIQLPSSSLLIRFLFRVYVILNSYNTHILSFRLISPGPYTILLFLKV